MQPVQRWDLSPLMARDPDDEGRIKAVVYYDKSWPFALSVVEVIANLEIWVRLYTEPTDDPTITKAIMEFDGKIMNLVLLNDQLESYFKRFTMAGQSPESGSEARALMDTHAAQTPRVPNVKLPSSSSNPDSQEHINDPPSQGYPEAPAPGS